MAGLTIKYQRIGILGGTFDPPHIGHLILAEDSADQFNLEKVFWLLTPDPPHKTGEVITPADIRRKWVEATIQANSRFELSTVDIDRDPPHYAFDSIKIFKTIFPGTEIYYLMGSDSMLDLQDWNQPEKVISSVDRIVVYHRTPENRDFKKQFELFPELEDKTRLLETPSIGISSSVIRKRVREGKSIRYLVDDNIREDIKIIILNQINSL